MRIQITRETAIPDKYKLARFLKSPELGPKILFFSGGTALRDISQKIINYTHNSIHLITPFDSGGSSAVLRETFKMPAIGDIRNRLMALADQSIKGNPEIFRLFSHRLSKKSDRDALEKELLAMVRGRHPLVAAVPDPMRKIIRHHLEIFAENMPNSFNLNGASIGNLVLTGGYLENKEHIDPVIYIFSKLVEVRGIVRPIINTDMHLAARLDNGQTIVGQHLLTGKETPRLKNKIREIYLVNDLRNPVPAIPVIRHKIKKKILDADLICYPIGSFFSSVIANLLPEGVSNAIGESKCPKIFIPNTAPDPECHAMTLTEQLQQLMHTLLKNCDDKYSNGDLLNFILLDHDFSLYPGSINKSTLIQFGIEIIECELVTENSKPFIDPEKLCSVLLSLC